MIDYQKYINALRKCVKEQKNDRTSTGHIIVSDLCRDTANLLESLEQESKTGHWNEIPKYKDIAWQCSECEHFTTMKHNFCPNCGAKMESEDSNA